MNMREKMARAMYDAIPWLGDDSPPARRFDDLTEGERGVVFAQADAALDALMEPTMAMTSAAITAASASAIPPDGRTQFDYYCWMIRAAKEGK